MLRSRLVTTALVLCASVGATAAVQPATAAKAKVKPASAAKILKDCKRNGYVTKQYRLADLKKARTTQRKKPSKYGDCDLALPSAIAGLSGKKGKNSASAIYKECARGPLKKRYRAATLRKAVDNLGDDAANYTTCEVAIRSQLNTVSKKG